MLVVLFSMLSVITDQTRMDFVINLTSEKQENVKGGEIQYTFYSLSLNDHHEMISGNSQPGNIFMTILKKHWTSWETICQLWTEFYNIWGYDILRIQVGRMERCMEESNEV